MAKASIGPSCWVLFLASAAATAFLTPAIIRLAVRAGVVDGGGYRRISNSPKPLLGGLAIGAPFTIICLLGVAEPTRTLVGLQGVGRDFAVLAAGGAAVLAAGVVDDVRRLRPRTKLLIQVGVALVICAGGGGAKALNLPLIGAVGLGPVLGALFTIGWLVGIINAMTLVDGLDGLAAGLALIGAVALALLAGMSGSAFVVLLCAALAGSLLAFLFYNFHPARIFLGETGSMFLGFVLATVALMGSHKTDAAVVFLAPVLALGLPIYETLTSVARRLMRGKPLLAGDRGHTYHRLLRLGLSQRQVALTLYTVAFCCTLAAVLCQMAHARGRAAWAPIALFVLTMATLSWTAGYLRVPDAVRGARRRHHNRLLRALCRYAALRLGSGNPVVGTVELMRLVRRELGLRFLEAWTDDGPVQLLSSGRMRFRPTGGSPIDAEAEAEPAFVAMPNGYVADEEMRHLPVDLLETIRVRAASGHTMTVRYQHYFERPELERQDVAGILAQLFEQVNLSPPAPEAVRTPRLPLLLPEDSPAALADQSAAKATLQPSGISQTRAAARPVRVHPP